MGQQQLLLIVLGVLIVGTAVYGAVRMVDAQRTEHSRNRVIQEGHLLMDYADEYKNRLKQLGGGGGTYDGFQLPKFFIDEPDIGYWVSGSGNFVQVYACGWGNDAPRGDDGKSPVAVLITKYADGRIELAKLN
jgi:hypothetical protein